MPPLEHPTLAAATRYIAGSTDLEVGGDWLDLIERDDGSVVVIVGDVVGRGIRAATAMGKLRSAIGALAHVTDDPARMLERLDRFATRVAGAELATVVCAVVAPDAGTLTYSSAGHVPGVLVSGHGKPACSNAVRYAYEDGQGSVRVRLTYERGVLTIRVSETGKWTEPRQTPDDTGRGLEIIRALVDRSSVRGTPQGTTIVMQKHVAAVPDR